MEIKDITLPIILGVVLIILVVQSIQLNELNKMLITGAATATGAIDMTGWTEDEKMNYDMHGVIPSKANGGSSAGASMVGGC